MNACNGCGVAIPSRKRACLDCKAKRARDTYESKIRGKVWRVARVQRIETQAGCVASFRLWHGGEL